MLQALLNSDSLERVEVQYFL